MAHDAAEIAALALPHSAGTTFVRSETVVLAPIETALLARAHPHVLAARLRALVSFEEGKGCRREIADRPVPLEPPFQSIGRPGELQERDLLPNAELAELDAVPWTRLRVWISPEQICEWNRSELFLKNLACLCRRIGWEIIGNREGITYQLLCHSDDVPLIQAAFSGQFELCRATELATRGRLAALPVDSWNDIRFREFFPPGPYSHLMTRPAERSLGTVRPTRGPPRRHDPACLDRSELFPQSKRMAGGISAAPGTVLH